MLTKNAVGNLINRYKAVLDNCRLLNVFGTLALAGAVVLGGVGEAQALYSTAYRNTVANYNPATSNLTNLIDAYDDGKYSIAIDDNNEETTESESEVSFIVDGTTFYVLEDAEPMSPMRRQHKENYNPIELLSSDSVGKRTNNTGGALHNAGIKATIKLITPSSFIANEASSDQGGAIFNNGYIITISAATFIGNKATAGGAIYNLDTIGDSDRPTSTGILNSIFIGNTAFAGNGGAICNTYSRNASFDSKDIAAISNSTFIGNKAAHYGGAICNTMGITNGIIDSTFIGNTAGTSGGAVYTQKSLTFNAATKDLLFTDNIAGEAYNAISSFGDNIDLTFSLSGEHDITMNDSIIACSSQDVTNPYDVIITGTGKDKNTFYLNDSIDSQGFVTIKNATLELGSCGHEGGSIDKTTYGSFTWDNLTALTNNETLSFNVADETQSFSLDSDTLLKIQAANIIVKSGLVNVNDEATFSGTTTVSGGTLMLYGNAGGTTFGMTNISGGTLGVIDADANANFTGNISITGGELNVAEGTTTTFGTSSQSITITIGTDGKLKADLADFGMLNTDTTFTLKEGNSFTLDNDGTLILDATGTTIHRLQESNIRTNIDNVLNGKATVTGWIVEGLYSLNNFGTSPTATLNEQVMAGNLESGENLTAYGLVTNDQESGFGDASTIVSNSILTLTGYDDAVNDKDIKSLVGSGLSINNLGTLNLGKTGSSLGLTYDGTLSGTGTTNVTSDLAFTGTLSIGTGGSLAVANGATLDITGATLRNFAGTMTINVGGELQVDYAKLGDGKALDTKITLAQANKTATLTVTNIEANAATDSTTYATLLGTVAGSLTNACDTHLLHLTSDGTIAFKKAGGSAYTLTSNYLASFLAKTGDATNGYDVTGTDAMLDGVIAYSGTATDNALSTKLIATKLDGDANGTFTINNGAALTLEGGAIEVLLDEGSLTNNGTLTLQNGTFAGKLTANVGSTTKIDGDVNFTADATIKGKLDVQANKMLTIENCTVDVFNATDFAVAGSIKLNSNTGKLIADYDDGITVSGNTVAKTTFAQAIMFDGGELVLDFANDDRSADTSMTSTDLRAKITNAAGTYGSVNFAYDATSHLAKLTSGASTISFDGYDLTSNYLATFIADSGDADVGYIVGGNIAYDSATNSANNTLAAGTKLTADRLVGSAGKAFTIEDTASLTLTGENNTTLLNEGALVNNGVLTLGDGSGDNLQFNGILVSNQRVVIDDNTTFTNTGTYKVDDTTTLSDTSKITSTLTIEDNKTLTVASGTLDITTAAVNATDSNGISITGGELKATYKAVIVDDLKDKVAFSDDNATAKLTLGAATSSSDAVTSKVYADMLADIAKADGSTGGAFDGFTYDAHVADFNGEVMTSTLSNTNNKTIELTGYKLSANYLASFITGTAKDNTTDFYDVTGVLGGNIAYSGTATDNVLGAKLIANTLNVPSTGSAATNAEFTIDGSLTLKGANGVLANAKTVTNNGVLTLGVDGDTNTFNGALTTSGTTTVNGTITITGAVISSGSTTFTGNAGLNSTLTVSGGTTAFNGGGSVTGATKVTDGATLTIAGTTSMVGLDVNGADESNNIAASNLNITSGTLSLTAASDIDGNLNFSGGTLEVGNTVDISDANVTYTSGAIIVKASSTLTANFGDFVTGAKDSTGDYDHNDTKLELTTLADKITINDSGTLDLVGGGAYVNKEDFAEFLNGTGDGSWGKFITGNTTDSASCTISYGTALAIDATTDNVYTFGKVSITGLNLTKYYSLDRYVADTNVTADPVIGGTLAENATLTSATLLHGTDQNSDISKNATLTLTGAGYTENGTAQNANVLVTGGSVFNCGTLNLGTSTSANTLTFTGNLTTGKNSAGTATNTDATTIAHGPIKITGDVNNFGTTTFEKDANIGGAVKSSGTTEFKGGADLDSSLTVDAGTTTFGGTANITGAVESSGKIEFKDTASITGTLAVASTGEVLFSNTGKTATITGDVTSSHTLTFAGGADLDSSLTVSAGTTTFGGTTTIAGAVDNSSTLIFNGGATLSDAVTSSGALTFAGAADLDSSLKVTGGTTKFTDADKTVTIAGVVESSDTLTFAGDADLNSTLTVSAGTTTFGGTTTIAGAVGNSSTLIFNGGATLSDAVESTGTTTFAGAADLDSWLKVTDGETKFTDEDETVTIAGKVESSDTLTFDGGADLDGALTVDAGTTTFGGTTTIDGAVGNSSTLIFNGGATLSDAVESTGTTTFAGAADLDSSLKVTSGETKFTDTTKTASIAGKVESSDTLTFAGGADLDGALNVIAGETKFTNTTKTVTIAGAVDNSSTLIFNGGATLSDAVTSSGTLTFAGKADLHSSLNITSGTATFGGVTSIDGVVSSTGTTTFNGAATLGSTLGISGNTTFNNGGSVDGKTTVNGGNLAVGTNTTSPTETLSMAGLNLASGSTLNISSDTLKLTGSTAYVDLNTTANSADSSIKGNLTMTGGTLEIASGLTDMRGATVWDNGTSKVAGTISIGDDGTLVAYFADFVTGASGTAEDANKAHDDGITKSTDVLALRTGLADNVELVASGAKLILDGNTQFINKEDFAEFLNGKGTASWGEFVTSGDESAAYTIDYGSGQNASNDTNTTDNTYTFKTSAAADTSTITITNVKLTELFSLTHYLANQNSGVYKLDDQVISGTLAKNVKLTATTLVQSETGGPSDSIVSTISKDASLTLTGGTYDMNGDGSTAGAGESLVLVQGGKVINNGTLVLDEGTFNANLVTGATTSPDTGTTANGSITIKGTVTSAGKTTFKGDATLEDTLTVAGGGEVSFTDANKKTIIKGAVESSGTLTFSGEADLDSTLTVNGTTGKLTTFNGTTTVGGLTKIDGGTTNFNGETTIGTASASGTPYSEILTVGENGTVAFGGTSKNTATIYGAVTSDGALSFTGAADIKDTLTVEDDGNVSFTDANAKATITGAVESDGMLTFSGEADLDSTLTVNDGTTTFDGITVIGDAAATPVTTNPVLIVGENGEVVFGDDVNDTTTIYGAVTSAGTTSFTGAADIKDTLTVEDDGNVSFKATDKKATITGAVTSDGTLTFSGDADLDSTLTVNDGKTSFDGITVIGDAAATPVTTNPVLIVGENGEVVFGDDVNDTTTINGAITSSGTTSFTGAADIKDTLTVDKGTTTFNDTTTIGTAPASGTTSKDVLTVTGGTATLGGATTINGKTKVTTDANATVGTKLVVDAGSTNVAGVITPNTVIMKDEVNVDAGSTFDVQSGTVVLTKDSTIAGKLAMTDGASMEAQGIDVTIAKFTAGDDNSNTGTAPYIYAKDTTDTVANTGSASTITFAKDFNPVMDANSKTTCNLDASLYTDGASDIIFGTLPTKPNTAIGDSATDEEKAALETYTQFAYIQTELYENNPDNADVLKTLTTEEDILDAAKTAFTGYNMLYVGLEAPLKLGNGAKLVVGGTPTATTTGTGSYFGKDSILVADVADINIVPEDNAPVNPANPTAKAPDAEAVIDGGGSALKVDANSTLALINAEDHEYVILDNFGTLTSTEKNEEEKFVPWNEDSIIVGNYLFVVDSVSGTGEVGNPYKVLVRRNIPDAVYESDSANIVANIVNSGKFKKNSGDPIIQFLYDSSVKNADNPEQFLKDAASIVNAGHASGGNMNSMVSVRGAAETLVSRATIVDMSSVTKGGGTAVVKDEYGNVTAEYENVIQLAAGGDSISDAPAALGGTNAGPDLSNSIGLWAMPFYAHESLSGAQVGEYENNTHTDMYGMTMGIDKTFTPTASADTMGIDVCRVGVAFNVGTGKTEAHGDTGDSQSDFDFFGLAAYGSMRIDALTINGSASYTRTEGEFSNGLVTGETVGDVWYGVLNAEYAFDMGGLLGRGGFFNNFKLVPYAGLGFMTADTKDYTTNVNTKVSTDRQNMFSVPFGLKFNKEFTLDSGWIMKPEVNAGVVYADGDLNQRIETSNPFGSGVDDVSSQVVDQMTMDLGFGVDIRKDDFGIFLDYSLQKSDIRTAHGVSAKFEYRF